MPYVPMLIRSWLLIRVGPWGLRGQGLDYMGHLAVQGFGRLGAQHPALQLLGRSEVKITF